jgi:protein phosphatase
MVVHATSLPHPEQLPQRSERIAFVAMVADGVGGSTGGGEASELALQAIAEYVTHSFLSLYALDASHEADFLKMLQQSALAAHEAVRDRAGELGGKSATTLTLLFGLWPRVFVLQVGDSRAYLYRGGALQLITRDQTYAQDLLDRGALRPEDVARSPLRHVLSGAIGGSAATPVVTKHHATRDTVFLLCTDGLTKHVPDERIAERLRNMQSSEHACETLLHDALEGGGSDNVTVLVGRIRPETPTLP